MLWAVCVFAFALFCISIIIFFSSIYLFIFLFKSSLIWNKSRDGGPAVEGQIRKASGQIVRVKARSGRPELDADFNGI